MIDREGEASKRAIAALEDEATRKHLLRYAAWRTHDETLAKDLLADAIARVLDPGGQPWTVTTVPFRRHMRMVMDDLVIARARLASSRLEVIESTLARPGDDDDGLPDPADDHPLPDEQVHERRKTGWLRQLWGRLEKRLAGKDPLLVRVYGAACLGHETPEEQAKFLDVPVEDVYEALRRLRYQAAFVMDGWKEEERRAMLEARTRAEEEGELT